MFSYQLLGLIVLLLRHTILSPSVCDLIFASTNCFQSWLSKSSSVHMAYTWVHKALSTLTHFSQQIRLFFFPFDPHHELEFLLEQHHKNFHRVLKWPFLKQKWENLKVTIQTQPQYLHSSWGRWAGMEAKFSPQVDKLVLHLLAGGCCIGSLTSQGLTPLSPGEKNGTHHVALF